MCMNDSHKILNELVSFEKYEQRVEKFLTNQDKNEEWIKESFDLISTIVRVTTKSEEEQVFKWKEFIIKTRFLQLSSQVSSSSDSHMKDLQFILEESKKQMRLLTESIKKLDSVEGQNALLNDNKSNEPKGVRGWLALFYFGLFVGAIGNVFYVFQTADSLSAVIDAVLCIYSVYILYLLAKIKPNAVKQTKLFLTAMAVVGTIMSLLIYISNPNTDVSSAQGPWIRMAFWGVVWLVYFFKSKRVKATYQS